jgi:hypothetical protein
LGVYALYEWLKNYFNKTAVAALSTVVCMGVPALLAAQYWDDHDRSGRYLVWQTAKAYLDSCAPNAILFTNGDNDTFPLWYLQEVEGYRTDIRICNLSLMGTDWYIDQAKRKAYDGLPVPISMPKELYIAGTRDVLQAQNTLKEPQNIKNVMQEIYKPVNNRRHAVINTINFYMDVDKEKALASGAVPPELADRIVDRIVWRMPSSAIRFDNGKDTIMLVSKAYIGMMDILANNNWERPIYYVSTTGSDSFFGLEQYFQMEGMAYRLLPVFADDQMAQMFTGRINTDVLYDKVMNKYDYSQYADKSIFLSEDFTRMTTNLKIFFFRLSEALIRENKMDSAEKVLDKCYQWFPRTIIPYSGVDYSYIGRILMTCNTPSAIDKGIAYYDAYTDQLLKEMAYYVKFKGKQAAIVENELSRCRYSLNEINQLCQYYSQNLDEKYKEPLNAIAQKTALYSNNTTAN